MTEETAVVDLTDEVEVENINTEGEKKKKGKRGRKAAPVHNYKQIFSSADECDKNPPLDEKEMPVEGYRAYELTFSQDVSFTAGATYFIQARSGDQACSFLVSHYVETKPVHEQTRGPSKKIDENYLKYCKLMFDGGMNDGLQQFFAEHEHYQKIDFSQPIDVLIEEYITKK